MTIDSLDELIDYVEKKKISPHKLARVSGYCRTHIRNCIVGLTNPTDEALETIIEAALEIGEQVTFNRGEMNIIRNYFTGTDKLRDINSVPIDKPASMTDREWKEFLGKLS